MTREEAIARVKGYLTDCISIEGYEEVEEIVKALEQEPILEKDGTLVVTTENYKNVGRVLVQYGINGSLFYQDEEPCEDAVSRAEVIKFAEFVQSIKDEYQDNKEVLNHGTLCDIVIQAWKLTKLPSVTPTRKKGKWIKHDTGHSIYYDCSLCNCVAPCIETADKILWKLSKYCLNCGAEMEK